tara:strand:+ start:6736 stop:7581 length:846 start_codon:yes stop_codon:yes gene_type:complete
MAIIRNHKNKDYTVMSNNHLNNNELTLKAKGLLSFMLSKPDSWDFSVRGLSAQLKEGKDCVARAINELIKHRYVVREQEVSDESFKFSKIIYHVYENPCPGNRDTVKPDTVNRPQVNTKEVNTEEVNTKKEKNNIKEIQEVISYLNDTVGKSFKADSRNSLSLINARLKDYSVDDLKKVIKYKSQQWLKDKIMSPYLRPSTLFNATKFENYINEIPKDFSVKRQKKNKYTAWSLEPETIPFELMDDWFGMTYDQMVKEKGTVTTENLIISKLMEENAKGNI